MGSAGRPKADSTSKNPGDRRRYDLLEAAFTLIGERGLEGLRTRAIAARAGVNISTLHYYFGTKEALLVAMVDHAKSKFLAAGAAQTGLRDHFEGSLRTFQSSPHLSAVLQELALRAQRDPVTRTALADLHAGWNTQVAALIRLEIARGSLRPDLDAQAGAQVITSFILGANVQLAVNPAALDFRALADQLQRWLLTGVGAGR